MKYNFLIFKFILCILSVNLFSCRGAQQTAASTEPVQSPLVTPVVQQPGDNSIGFRVWAQSSPFATYVSHKGSGLVSDNFSSLCEVNPSDSTKDIQCLIEGEELDLYFQGMALNYNVPSSMCSYVTVSMPFYFNNIAGIGPVSVTDNFAGSIAHSGVSAGSTNETCVYKYTDIDGNETQNCCVGNYNLTTWSTTASGPGFDSAVSVAKKWGGKVGNCLMGPAKKVKEMPQSNNGIPLTQIFYVEGIGIRSSYAVPSPISLEFASNVFISNYFLAADHVGGVPLAYTPVPDFPTFFPNQKYVFSCLDRAHDPIARITLSVREWNEESQFLIGPTGNPDTTGSTPFGTPINNRRDLKDLGAARPNE
jgi:hypothetical protein